MNDEKLMENAQGHFIPISKVKPIDLLRDKTVKGIMERVIDEAENLKTVKKEIASYLQDFLEVSANQHGVKYGGKKGNVSISSFDGCYKLEIANSDVLSFNEKLQVAKGLINLCINRWITGSNDEIRCLVGDAFNVDKAGNISTSKVLGLRKLDIMDAQWQEAMQAITESITIVDSKRYMRFYKKNEVGKFEQISLDVASL